MPFQYRKFRVPGYIVIGILFYLIFNLINPWDYEEWSVGVLIDMLRDIGVSIVGVVIVVELGLFITKKLDVLLPWRQSMKKRIVVQLITQIAIVTLIIAGIRLLMPALFTEGIVFRQAIVIGIILSVLITAIFTAESFFTQWNRTSLEVVKYEQQVTRAQLEFLKMQVDPHFLFNNFSTLTSLIEDNPQLAVEYLQRLSAIYRHMLTDTERDVVPLEEELAFIESYLFLYKTRYQESLIVDVDISDKLREEGIATATLQLLVENAIKHNSISRQKPLKIEIYIENGFLVVKNNINQVSKRRESTGIGLKNILERYKLLSTQQVSIEEDKEKFIVKVPLL